MSNRTLRTLINMSLFAIFLVALLATSLNTFAAKTEKPDGLFIPTDRIGILDFSNDQTVVNMRFVGVNFAVLDESEVGDTLVLNLFDDEIYKVILDRKTPTFGGGYAWNGHLEDIPLGSFVLVVGDGQVAGNISTPGALYAVRYAGNQVHAVQLLKQSAFPPEAQPVELDLTTEKDPNVDPNELMDDGSQIDTMVVYTADARAAAGGTAAIQNLINLAISETNTGYLNSGVTQRLTLVHMQEVVYTETGSIGTDLSNLKNPFDGYMDNVHALRDTHHADVVSLIVDNGGAYCGVAYLMDTVSTTFEDHAFSVVADTCATGYYSFGHELGHNMGTHHDWYVEASLNRPYSYNKGNVNWSDRWRTIMAYNSECINRGDNCTRINYWSNPYVLYGGDPTGVPIGTSTACSAGNINNPDCDAYNALVLNNTAWTVANFRQRPAVVGPLEYNSYTVDDDNNGDSRGNNNGIVDCGETIELSVDMYNAGADTVSGINTTISTIDPNITFIQNTSSGYPDIPGYSTATNTDDFDFAVNTFTPDGHVIAFDVHLDAVTGGPWRDTFDLSVNCDNPQVAQYNYFPLIIVSRPPVGAGPESTQLHLFNRNADLLQQND